jgi:hypothetical protein
MTDEKDAKPETPRDRLFRLHEDMTKAARTIMRKKNADYANEEDPLANFRRFGELGFVVRMEDKLARLTTFARRGILEVENESLDDTLLDLVNYCVLLSFYVTEEKRKRAA